MNVTDGTDRRSRAWWRAAFVLALVVWAAPALGLWLTAAFSLFGEPSFEEGSGGTGLLDEWSGEDAFWLLTSCALFAAGAFGLLRLGRRAMTNRGRATVVALVGAGWVPVAATLLLALLVYG